VHCSALARSIVGQGPFLVVDGATSAALASRLLAGGVADPVLAATPPAPEMLSVVIAVRDRCEQLDRALGALAGRCRVLVVDDASYDAAAVARVARRHGAEVIALSVNVGPAGARNAGLAAVRTPYVAFVDSDVTVTTATLLRLARHLEDPAVALVGPRITGVARTARPGWVERYDALAPSLGLGARAGVVRPGAAVGWLPAACLVGRVAHLRDGFDPALRVAEDVDLVWRLVASGRTVRYAPDQHARHDSRATARDWLARTFLYGTGGAALAQRHGSHGAPAVLSPAVAVAATSLLLARWWSVPVASLALARSGQRLLGTLPQAPGRSRLAAELSVRGLGWGLRQESALLLRHWWPLTALGVLTSRHVRRAALSALVVDTAVAVAQHHDGPRSALTLLAGRRLEDLAYGAGLWVGAIRNRSLRCLMVRIPAASRRPGPSGRRE